ncbi:hypothetical protein Bbelb_015580 [Branchiostoma belcheri]|nr:hypothetical protein Bbelb_015580 [Branchiostoma belcheri]
MIKRKFIPYHTPDLEHPFRKGPYLAKEASLIPRFGHFASWETRWALMGEEPYTRGVAGSAAGPPLPFGDHEGKVNLNFCTSRPHAGRVEEDVSSIRGLPGRAELCIVKSTAKHRQKNLCSNVFAYAELQKKHRKPTIASM